MLTSVVSAWLATPRPPSGTVPIRPTIAESASRNSGSATRDPNAGTASRRMSRSCPLPRSHAGRMVRGLVRPAASAVLVGGGTRPPSKPSSLAIITLTVTNLISESVTGQVNFTSHTSAVVTVAVRLVNALTPGDAHGRPYRPPTGRALPAAVAAALRAARTPVREVSPAEAAGFPAVATAIRAVFEATTAGHADTASGLVNEMLASSGARPRLDRH